MAWTLLGFLWLKICHEFAPDLPQICPRFASDLLRLQNESTAKQMEKNLGQSAEQTPAVEVGDLIPENCVNADETVCKPQALDKP